MTRTSLMWCLQKNKSGQMDFTLDLKQKQMKNIIFITFWSQFSVYVINTIFILFLTRPIIAKGLGYDQAKAYAFIGVTQATGYLMPLLGGYMADVIIGVRRSILIGSILVALAYLLVMLSGFTINTMGDRLFIAAFALIPAVNSLLMGTSSALISSIYAHEELKAKSAMTYYYMSINLGGILATLVAPSLLDSRFGALSIFAVTFIGKSIAGLNFAQHYRLYDNVVWGQDNKPFLKTSALKLVVYIAAIYFATLYAYLHVEMASVVISIGCALGLVGFFISTLRLKGSHRNKQLIAIILILEAVVFFIIYNQMGTTLILFAKHNSDLNLLGIKLSPAQYQMLNPLLILCVGGLLSRFYGYLPRFTIPYQFAVGTMIAGFALLIMAFAATHAHQGIVNGNYIGLTYVLITIAELLVSAIGLSMIGLYCDEKTMAMAMGVWYVASSMSGTISGKIAAWVAIPASLTAAQSLLYYKPYYLILGLITFGLGFFMAILAYFLHKIMRRNGVDLV